MLTRVHPLILLTCLLLISADLFQLKEWVLKPLPEVANGVRANEDFVVASTEAGFTSGSVTYGISQFDRLNGIFFFKKKIPSAPPCVRRFILAPF